MKSKTSISIQCGSARLAKPKAEFSEHINFEEETDQWSTMLNPPSTPKDPEKSLECPLTHQKEAGDDNPPKMQKRVMWQLMGLNSMQLPIAICCDSEIEAWTRIYPGNPGEDSNPNDHIYSLLNMFKNRTTQDDIKQVKLINDIAEEGGTEVKAMPITKASNCHGEIKYLKKAESDLLSYSGRKISTMTAEKAATFEERLLMSGVTYYPNGSERINSPVHQETNTEMKVHKEKEINCRLQDYIQQIEIYDSSTRMTKSPVLNARKKFLTSNTLSVTSVSSRLGSISNKASPISRPDADVRQCSPDPAISRTGLFSAAPKTSTMRPTDTFINRSKCRMKIKKEKPTISENEDNV